MVMKNFIPAVIFTTRKIILYAAILLEKFLWVLDWFLTGSILAILLLSISKRLYLSENQENWTAFMALLTILVALNLILRLFECFMIHRVYPHDLCRIASIRKSKRRIKIHRDIMWPILGVLSIVCFNFASFYLGGDSRTFTGDPWWVVAGEWPFKLDVGLMFGKLVQWNVYTFILDHVDN